MKIKIHYEKHFRTILLLVLISGVAVAANYYFSVKTTITVTDSTLRMSPKTHTFNASKGMIHVKEFKIENTGGSVNVYFDEIVMGPSADKIRVYYYDEKGNKITSSNKLSVPAGNVSNPSIVSVFIWIEIDDDAETGEYTIISELKT